MWPASGSRQCPTRHCGGTPPSSHRKDWPRSPCRSRPESARRPRGIGRVVPVRGSNGDPSDRGTTREMRCPPSSLRAPRRPRQVHGTAGSQPSSRRDACDRYVPADRRLCAARAGLRRQDARLPGRGPGPGRRTARSLPRPDFGIDHVDRAADRMPASPVVDSVCRKKPFLEFEPASAVKFDPDLTGGFRVKWTWSATFGGKRRAGGDFGAHIGDFRKYRAWRAAGSPVRAALAGFPGDVRQLFVAGT